MSTDVPPSHLSLQTQLESIMQVLARAAVIEISQLFSESSVGLQLEISRSYKENEALRMRMRVMKSELVTLRLQRSSAPRGGRFSFGRAFCRPRAKQIDKPPECKDDAHGPMTVAEEGSPTFQNEESADVESNCPDVILIKEEEGPEVTFGGRVPDAGQDNIHKEDVQVVAMAIPPLEPISRLCHEGPRIVSVCGHGQGQEPLDGGGCGPENSLLFRAPELQSLPALMPGHAVNHDPQLSSHTGGRVSMEGVQGCGGDLGRGGPATTTAMTPAKTLVPSSVRRPIYTSQFQRHHHHHMPHGTKVLVCADCGKRFSRHVDLMCHRTLHTGERPVVCTLCRKTFANKTTLNVHMRIHTGERPYVCSLCGKGFTQNGSLTIHLRTHSGEKPYSCSHCGASFNNPSNLRRHMVIH